MRERTIIVTGGTGALGRVVVQRFLDAGNLVVVPWIDKPERDAAGRSFGEALPSGRVALIEADIATEEGAARIARSAPEVDVLINAAGGFEGGKPIYDSNATVWDRMYRINLRTAVTMTQAILPGMIQRRRGNIINVTAQAAFATPPNLGAYAASKAGVVVLTETLHAELASTNLRINAVACSTIDTPANRAAMPSADVSTWTQPTQIADVMLWLTSDAAKAVRGAIIPV